MTRKSDPGADYTDVVVSGGVTYVGKKRKGNNDPPHPMPRATTGPNSADTKHEVWVLGSIQVRLARLWSEPLIATQLQ